LCISKIPDREFCNPNPFIFEGFFRNAGYISVDCDAKQCSKICDPFMIPNSCNGTILNATNVLLNKSGNINTLTKGDSLEKNNIIVFVNCSQTILNCQYLSTTLASNPILQPNSINVIESTSPYSTITYSCT
jgi:hypothetical protein